MTKPITEAADVQIDAPQKAPVFRHNAPADRFMRALLRVKAPRKGAILGAHSAFRWSLAISGIRCIITYLLVPILVPFLSFGGWVVTPLSIALCLYAFVNGIISVRRFWIADHRQRWTYTGFMALVFVVLIVALVTDITRLISGF